MICDCTLQGRQIRDDEKILFSIATQYENIARQVYVFKN